MAKHGLLNKSRLRIFDQGFGLGLMLFCFPKDCFLAGYELSSRTIASAKAAAHSKGYSATDFRVLRAGESLPEQWRESFDVVISSHVLEHIADPMPALKQLLALLKPGGVACILVPINELPGEDLNHFSYFTESSLSAMLGENEMEIIHSGSIDRLYRLLKPLALARQRRDTIGLRVISKLVNAVLAPLPLGALYFFDWILGLLSVPPAQCLILSRKP
jgi:2-polyprenyl-3-methyl-5-hydroxy-6-metoxy-1,4-benzoquinol methylase